MIKDELNLKLIFHFLIKIANFFQIEITNY